MSNDWRNYWRKSRWVTLADFPLLSLDINPATYEGGHPDAGHRGNELLKQAFAADDERVRLRMRTQPGSPQHRARHLVRMACRPGQYQPDDMDREVFLQDAIAFAIDVGWDVPEWLHSILVGATGVLVSLQSSNQSAEDQGAQGESPATRTNKLKSRTNSLDPIIKMAKERATDPSSYHSVWDAMVAIAESKNPPPPLYGHSSDGITYKGRKHEDEGILDVFTKRALRGRLEREEKAKAAPAALKRSPLADGT